ncbi:MAG: septation protein A [Rhizomicrobium sp.]|jgi:intracellular septation protein
MSDVRKPFPAGVKIALDWSPLALFFLVSKFASGTEDQKLYAATGTLMVAAVLALGIEYARVRKISPVPLITAVMVLIFGALTLYLKDPRFIKMKPTALYIVFSAVLLGGLVFDRALVRHALSHAFDLTEEAWRKLTFRYGLFFLGLAVLNEIVWRNFSQSIWIDFKVFGIIGLTVVFTFSQMPLIMKHQVEDGPQGETGH